MHTYIYVNNIRHSPRTCYYYRMFSLSFVFIYLGIDATINYIKKTKHLTESNLQYAFIFCRRRLRQKNENPPNRLTFSRRTSNRIAVCSILII